MARPATAAKSASPAAPVPAPAPAASSQDAPPSSTSSWGQRVGIAVAVLAVAAFVLKTAVDGGAFKTLLDHHLDGCVRTHGDVAATEDLQFLHGGMWDGWGIGGADWRRHWFPAFSLLPPFSGGTKNVSALFDSAAGWPGSLIAVRTLDATEPHNIVVADLKLVNWPAGREFHPHGVNLRYNDARTAAYAYIVNHHRDGDSVEVFNVDFGNRVATFVRSMSHPLFTNINDVVAAGDKEVYVTVFLSDYLGSLKAWFETVAQRPWSRVIRCVVSSDDAVECSVAATDLVLANGINLSNDATKLYVVSQRTVIAYDRDAVTGALTRAGSVFLNSIMDNIDILPESGDLLLAGHPNAFQTVKYSQKPTAKASTNAVRIPATALVANVSEPQFEELFQSTGTLWSMGSAVAFSGNYLVLGAVHQTGLVVCPLNMLQNKL